MISFRRSTVHRRVMIPVVMIAWLAGCTSWHLESQPIQSVLTYQQPDRVRITLLTGTVRELTHPVFANGYVTGEWVRENFVGQFVQVPIDSIASVETPRTDVVGSVVLAALLIGGIGAVVAGLSASGGTDPQPQGNGPRRCSACTASCPLVYSWDGADWRLDSGTFGGAIFKPLARTDVDNLDFAMAVDGVIRLRLANELDETEHVDALSLVAIDHAPGMTVVPDGAGIPHAVSNPRPPFEALDGERRSVLGEISWSDGWSWESSLGIRDTTRADALRDAIEVAFTRPPGENQARLLLDGHNTEWAAALVQHYVSLHGRETTRWYAAMNEDPVRARATGEAFAREGFLRADLWTADGWKPQGMFWEAGPEVTKRQVMSMDLSEMQGDTVRIRLESIPSFWRIDRVAIDYGPEPEFFVTDLSPRSATTGPGADVAGPLRWIDGDEWVMTNGDFAVLEFDVPAPPVGSERTYLLKTHGWYQINGLADIDGLVGEESAAEILKRMEREPGAISKTAVQLRNDVSDTLVRGR